MHASAEAIRLLERALTLAADSERELAVTTTLLPLVANAEGFACDRVQRLQRRALELAPEPSPPLLRSLALTALSKSDFEAAGRHGVALGARGERDGDGVLRVESEYVLGIAAFWQGALPAAREHFEAAIARYRPEYRTTHTLRFGVDPYIVCVSRLANTLAFLGEPDAARRARDEALAVATDAGHAPSTETVLVFASLLALDLGDDVRPYAAALARATVKPAAVTGEALAGYVQVLDGQRQAGLARARRALDGAGFDAPGHRATLARIVLAACVAAGDTDAGVAAAEDLLAAGAGAPLWAPVARAFLRNARGTAAPA
jgi:tetratricopeptide (TPR) repeat protein